MRSGLSTWLKIRRSGSWLGVALGLLLGFGTVWAEERSGEVIRPVNSAYLLEAGSAHIGDSYLSPLMYEGWRVAFQYERMQAMKFAPERWNMQWRMGVEYSSGENPAKNATMRYAAVNLSWGMMRKYTLPWGIGAGVGGYAGINGGAVYSARNSNNPVSAKADAAVGVTGYLTRRFRIGRLPLMVKWQSEFPLAGAFFSPEYDELYYEIWLGNRRGLAHFGWPGNMMRWDNLVTVDLDLGNTHLDLGMRSKVCSTSANHINSTIYSWNFVVGVSGDWMSLSARRGVSDRTAQMIFAY